MNHTTFNAFDITQFSAYIIPVENEKGYHYCPHCGDKNFYIDPRNNRWGCFGSECSKYDVVKAIKTKAGVWVEKGEGYKSSPSSSTLVVKSNPIRKEDNKTMVAIDCTTEIPLAQFPGKPILPEPAKCSKGMVTIYKYSGTQRIYRLDLSQPDEKGNTKVIRPQYDNGMLEWVNGKGDEFWKLYRQDEAIKHSEGKWVVTSEGEKCVEAFREIGIVATTPQSNGYDSKSLKPNLLALKEAKIAGLVIFPDNDGPGKAKAEKIAAACDEISLPYVILDYSTFYPEIPNKGDIVEVLSHWANGDQAMADFVTRLENELHLAVKRKYLEAELVIDAVTESNQLANDSVTKSSKGKRLTQEDCANLIISEKKGNWAYHTQQATWREWNGKYWEAIHDDDIDKSIIELLTSKEIPCNTVNFVEGTRKFLRKLLGKSKWLALPHSTHVAFNNGVLELATNELREHQPSDLFINVLPYDYSPLSNPPSDLLVSLQTYCPITHKFFSQAMGGDAKKIVKLLAIINGIIKYQFSRLQMFVSCIGAPATGKGTFMRLLEKIVGKDNYQGARVGNLSQHYTVAAIIDKQLVICSDEDKLKGDYANLKSLTGGDSVFFRQIYKEATSSPFYGTIFVTSNGSIFGGDTVGLKRRICQIEFKNSISSGQRDPDLSDKIASEISSLIPISLSMPDSLVRNYIKGINEGEIAGLSAINWDAQCETDSVADWLDNWIIIQPGHYEMVGNKNTHESSLYRKYLQHCENVGKKCCSLNEFSNRIISHLSGLGYSVEKDKSNKGAKITGIRLRNDFDDILTLGEMILAKNKISILPSQSSLFNEGKDCGSSLEPSPSHHSDDPNADNEKSPIEKEPEKPSQWPPSDDLSDDLKPIQCKESDDRDDLKPKLSREDFSLTVDEVDISVDNDITKDDIEVDANSTKSEIFDVYFQFGDRVTFEWKGGEIIHAEILSVDYETGQANIIADNGTFYPPQWLDVLSHEKSYSD